MILRKCLKTSDIRLLTKDQIFTYENLCFMAKSVTNALRKMKFSAVFPNNLYLFYCKLSYMTELKVLMPKSAGSETKKNKNVKTVYL